VSPKQVAVINLGFDGGILSVILQVLTRYSANGRQFPADDGWLFTGKRHSSGRSVRSADAKLPSYPYAVVRFTLADSAGRTLSGRANNE
jgi:hypothetical protein